jgi:hypothetical protein
MTPPPRPKPPKNDRVKKNLPPKKFSAAFGGRKFLALFSKNEQNLRKNGDF